VVKPFISIFLPAVLHPPLTALVTFLRIESLAAAVSHHHIISSHNAQRTISKQLHLPDCIRHSTPYAFDRISTKGSSVQRSHSPTSMTLTSSGRATATALPYELYREIVENLHNQKDRKTLLSISLVSKVWSEQSQRVLYMEFCDNGVGERDKWVVRDRHTRFLCAIIKHPTRLGPHVRTYAHIGLADSPHSIRLCELLVEALPAMINLQHLHIIGGFSMAPNLFNHCTFQLRSLTLLHGVALDGPFLDFLRTQPEIRHLCISPSQSAMWPCQADLSVLPEDVCPNLLSASCIYESMAQVTKGRNVIALDMMVDFERMEQGKLNPNRLDFGLLRYLSLRIRESGQPSDTIKIVGNEIILLKLPNLNIEVCQ
jgi:hypothetical protein